LVNGICIYGCKVKSLKKFNSVNVWEFRKKAQNSSWLRTVLCNPFRICWTAYSKFNLSHSGLLFKVNLKSFMEFKLIFQHHFWFWADFYDSKQMFFEWFFLNQEYATYILLKFSNNLHMGDWIHWMEILSGIKRLNANRDYSMKMKMNSLHKYIQWQAVLRWTIWRAHTRFRIGFWSPMNLGQSANIFHKVSVDIIGLQNIHTSFCVRPTTKWFS